MAFIRMKGLKGKVFVPDDAGHKKHDCRDCFFCQMCSDQRCAACLAQQSRKDGKTCCKKRDVQEKIIPSEEDKPA